MADAAMGDAAERTRVLAAILSSELVAQARTRAGHTIDVVGELVHAVVMTNVTEVLLGVQDTSGAKLREWAQTIGYDIFNFWMGGGPYASAAAFAGAQMHEHLRVVIRARHEELRTAGPSSDVNDVLGRMLRALLPGKDLTPEQEVQVAYLMGGVISGAIVPAIGLSASVIDRLLNLRGEQQRLLCRAAKRGDYAKVWSYSREAARFTPYPPLLYRHAAASADVGEGKKGVVVQPGALVVTAPLLANLDARTFKHPGRFDPDRTHDKGAPILFGVGQHACLGEKMGEALITGMVTALFAKGARRVAGPEGRLTNGRPGAIPDGDFPQRLIVGLR
jgi:cytochrome P450